MISKEQKVFFKKNGYLVIKSLPGLNTAVNEIEKELLLFEKVFDKNINKLTDKNFFNILKKNTSSRIKFYNTLRYLHSVTKLTSMPILKKISISLGLKLPAIMRSYNLRMDMPKENKHLFQWHQDITYLLGSLNSITYWVPLTKVNKFFGSIEVVQGSHKKGIYDYKYAGNEKLIKKKSMSPKDIILKKNPNMKSKLINAKPGDLIIFSQFLLHKSTRNFSDKIRWVAQVRHSDLSEKKFKNAGYPFGDRENIFFNNYLKNIKKNEK